MTGGFNFPFIKNNIFVELFFALTGLLTYNHFYYSKDDSENIIIYCAKSMVDYFHITTFQLYTIILFQI